MANIPFSKLLGSFAKDGSTALNVLGEMRIEGTNVEEQLTEKNAKNNILTFTQKLSYVGIYNTDQEHTGVFNVNGIDINIPPGDTFEANIGGTPRDTVKVSGSTTYIVTRYV